MNGYLKIFKTMKNLIISVILKRPILFSLDITNKCNLNCPMCYWKTQKRPTELLDHEVINFVKRMKRKKVKIAGYVGGEPTLRFDLLKEVTELMPFNVVITNGTKICLPLKNTLIIVSVDGVEKIHDKIRGCKGLYKKIWNNYKDRKDVYLNTVLTNYNKNQIKPLLKEWSRTKIKGIIFNFATPLINEEDDFWVNWEDRHKIIDELLELKKEYGDFILISKKSLKLFRKETIKTFPKKCTCMKYSIDFKSNGEQKKPCVLGEKADCSRCGVHLPTFIPPLLKLDWESIRIFAKMFDNV